MTVVWHRDYQSAGEEYFTHAEIDDHGFVEVGRIRVADTAGAKSFAVDLTGPRALLGLSGNRVAIVSTGMTLEEVQREAEGTLRDLGWKQKEETA